MHIFVSCGTSGGTTILTFVRSFVLVDFVNELSTALRLRAPSSFVLCCAGVPARGLCQSLCLFNLALVLIQVLRLFHEEALTEFH